MLTPRWLFKAAASAVAVTLALLVVTCGGGSNATPTPDPRIDRTLEALDELAETVRRLETQLVADAESASPTPSSAAIPVPLPLSATPAPTPTPNPKNSGWVKERVDAVAQLYALTDSGVALMRSLDLRQMRGDPGFFGSYGFKKWAGVGEAKPIGVIHEISHSYWGGFPVQGMPELSWENPDGEALSPALEHYHADIISFMSQPPDDYEVLRQRLRNLPEVSNDNREPLFHTAEGDLVYNTGGNLALVPPILRKYWSHFLNEGPFVTWYDALAWFQALDDEERTAASKYLGFEHLDLRSYGSLVPLEDRPNLIATRLEIIAGEEQQRLLDLAEQFNLLLGEAQKEEKFQFWRGYLRDKLDLYGRHRGYLPTLELPRAADLDAALNFLTDLSSTSPEEKAQLLTKQLPDQPFLVNFLPALDNRTLLELFGSGTPLPQGATLQATASFVERLERFAGLVEGVLNAGRTDPSRGAAALKDVISGIGLEEKEDLRLFFELFREEDPDIANQVVQAMDKDTIQQLMDPIPAQLRFAMSPEELLIKLDISREAEVSDLKRGIALLIGEPSGNFIIDEPYLDRMYEVISARRRAEPRDMARVLLETPFPLEGFIRHQPEAALALLDRDLDVAVRLVRQSDPVLSPPMRIIYRVIYADPVLAARLVQALDELAEAEMVLESLAYIAYDQSRLERVPDLPISLSQDGKFLRALLAIFGEPGLSQRLAETFALYSDRADTGQVSPEFPDQFHATLAAATATLPDGESRNQLNKIIEEVSLEYPAGR